MICSVHCKDHCTIGKQCVHNLSVYTGTQHDINKACFYYKYCNHYSHMDISCRHIVLCQRVLLSVLPVGSIFVACSLHFVHEFSAIFSLPRSSCEFYRNVDTSGLWLFLGTESKNPIEQLVDRCYCYIWNSQTHAHLPSVSYAICLKSRYEK